jgi:hypothetical protein
MNRNLREVAVRAFKTFAATFIGVVISAVVGVPVGALLITAALTGLVAGGAAFLTNLLGVSPVSVPGRAAMTFVQAFGAALVATGFVINEVTIVAALSAAVTATINFVKESNL